MMNQSTKPNGFSLIEVLVALVILSIALLALAGLMVYATTSNSFGGHMTEATTFAQDKLEDLRASSWVSMTPGSDHKPGSTGLDFSRRWSVNTNGDGTLRTVTITVNWNDGVLRSITFLSAVAQ